MSQSLSSQAVQDIVDRIAAGDLKDGEALPPEAELAAELGISR
ncbi:MAG: GntR family transcriptional regulator, partial [Trueperella sp.]|nr:GntR family transcriptional regulator [Trueperella sp.]